jgi:hypothetical protein
MADMTAIDTIVFVGLLMVTEKERRPAVFVAMLLISAAFALLRIV